MAQLEVGTARDFVPAGKQEIAIVDVRGVPAWTLVTVKLTVTKEDAEAGAVDPPQKEIVADSTGFARANFRFSSAQTGTVVLTGEARDGEGKVLGRSVKGVTIQ